MNDSVARQVAYEEVLLSSSSEQKDCGRHYALSFSHSTKTPTENIIEAIRTELRPIRFGDGNGCSFGMEGLLRTFKYVSLLMRLQM